MMIETDVLKALQTAGIAAVAAIANPRLPIKAIGRTFETTKQAPDGKYVEFVDIVNNRIGDYWDDSFVYQGIFRIITHWPINDEGAYPATLYRDQLASYFTNGMMLVSGLAKVQIYENPVASSHVVNGSELLYPFGLMYRCFRP